MKLLMAKRTDWGVGLQVVPANPGDPYLSIGSSVENGKPT